MALRDAGRRATSLDLPETINVSGDWCALSGLDDLGACPTSWVIGNTLRITDAGIVRLACSIEVGVNIVMEGCPNLREIA